MTVTWVLERDVFADGHDQLSDAVRRAGGEVVTWRDEWWDDGRWPTRPGPVVFHGSLANADRIRRELPWRPGAYCHTDAFACSRWWPQVSDLLLSPEHAVTTVAALVADGPPARYGPQVFVRPDSPLKPFSGRVLPRDAITPAALDHGFYFDDETLPVVVAPATTVTDEWRFVVADGRVVAGSGYLADGRTGADPLTEGHPAWAWATSALGRLPAPDPIFVLDVCDGPDGLRLLELNPFSGADLYSCDRDALVAAVHAHLG